MARKVFVVAKGEEHQVSPLMEAFFSEDSLEVIHHFGYKAPELLNAYSNELEDIIMEQRKEIDRLKRSLNSVMGMEIDGIPF